jgi:hypothetical protein
MRLGIVESAIRDSSPTRFAHRAVRTINATIIVERIALFDGVQRLSPSGATSMRSNLEDALITEDPGQVYLPSPERICRLTAVIRRRWSDREYAKRCTVKQLRWSLATVRMRLDVTESAESERF